VQTACKLNERWHSRLPKLDWSNVVRNVHYVCYGAAWENVWYAVAIWSTPVAANRMRDGEKVLELRRMAIAPDAPKNTASRMLRVMALLIAKKFPDVNRLISYQDTEVHKGTIYKAAGWTAKSRSKGVSWTTESRKRNADQTLADKVRWERTI